MKKRYVLLIILLGLVIIGLNLLAFIANHWLPNLIISLVEVVIFVYISFKLWPRTPKWVKVNLKMNDYKEIY